MRIKICGITNVADALAAVEAGADALGLNFYVKSKRCVDLPMAAEIIAALPAGVRAAAVFVNAPLSDIAAFHRRLSFDLLQLHGDEPPAFLAELAGQFPQVTVIRALRCGAGGSDHVADYLNRCAEMGHAPGYVLLDADAGKQYGGTGGTSDWQAAAACRSMPDAPPVILAGGLAPQNVAGAIRAVRPAAVDVASGVESSPGNKDSDKMRDFVQAARTAFAALE